MRQIYFITKKELTGYFFSPIAYVFICVFLLASMACTFYLGNFFASSEASLVYFFSFIGFFLYLNSLILEKKK